MLEMEARVPTTETQRAPSTHRECLRVWFWFADMYGSKGVIGAYLPSRRFQLAVRLGRRCSAPLPLWFRPRPFLPALVRPL